jgi:hypothetical protein
VVGHVLCAVIWDVRDIDDSELPITGAVELPRLPRNGKMADLKAAAWRTLHQNNIYEAAA